MRPVRSLLPFLITLLLAVDALARPGGGHTFGTGDDGFSGGGGGDDGGGAELIYLLIRLAFVYPELGIPLLLVASYIWWRTQRAQPQTWTSAHATKARAVAPSVAQRNADLSTLYELDPDFSRVIFDDFCYRLYASAYGARANRTTLASLSPYLNASVREQLAEEAPKGIAGTHVVVGSLRITRIAQLPARDEHPSYMELAVDYEANVSFGQDTTYRRERWVLQRAATARTKPPEETARLGCPNCGAPFESSDTRRCAYCSQVVDDARFGWQVARRQVLSVERRPPALASNIAETGTQRATVSSGSVHSDLSALAERDSAAQPGALEARLRHVYGELNRAWSAGDLATLRAITSDGMFDYLRYWIDAYRAQHLHNTLEQMRITRVQFAKVVHDKHFDSVTARLWASGRDYTRDVTTGRVVSGSERSDRDYSEYWTLIRSANVRGPSHNHGTCPSCAAPLKVSMAGVCTHCGSHLTRGEFDWVLSKIEQDDVYAG